MNEIRKNKEEERKIVSAKFTMPKIEVIVLKVLIIGFALLGAVGIIIGLTRGDFTLCNFFWLSVLFAVCWGLRFFGLKDSKFNVTNNKIMMEIKKEEMKSENMMNNKIKLIIKNMTKKTYEYEEDFYVEMEKDGKWYEVKWTEEPSFNSILHVIKGEETITTEIDGMFRESLTKGKYRIVKSFTEENASEDTEIVHSAVEFEVN